MRRHPLRAPGAAARAAAAPGAAPADPLDPGARFEGPGAPGAGLERALEEAERLRAPWEPLWRECYARALPSAAAGGPGAAPAPFDGTAAAGAADLAASLLAEIAPPGSRWCGLEASAALSEETRALLDPVLERAEAVLQEHFARSNFSMELHRSLLDLAVAGTGCLLFEASEPGAPSAFRFQSVPLSELLLAPGPDGDFGAVFRRRAAPGREGGDEGEEASIDAVRPLAGGGLEHARIEGPPGRRRAGAARRLAASPFVVFRWTRAPGEIWGRSPVMAALPEIRAADRVVELSLRSAALAAVGVWHADDDGVLDPARVSLEPGAVIPRAPGSRGLSPVETGRGFDLGQVVLSDLRARIRAALLSDRLSGARPPRRTATEVLADASSDARLLGAHYGRLSCELVAPLAGRALALLAEAGRLPEPFRPRALAAGRLPPGVSFRHRAPLAQLQSQRDSANLLLFIERMRALGPGAEALVDLPRAARHGARLLGVPESLLRGPGAGGGAPAPGAPVPIDLEGERE